MILRGFFLLSVICLCGCAQGSAADDASLRPIRATAAVADDADDPAVWVNSADPSRSLILGTNKVAAPGGGLYVFALDGRVKQVVAPLDRPNNVDVEYGFQSRSGPIDIAVVTERFQHRLRVFRVTESGVVPLDEGRGIAVMEGETGEARMPMGVALYKRPRDGTIFAIVAPKTGPTTGYLWQYRLDVDPASDADVARGTFVRRFGNFSGSGEIEAVAVDDALGYVYYADEEYAVHKWHADPDHPDAARELAAFGRDEFKGQREGIGIFTRSDGSGYIVTSDQIEGASELHIYPRDGRPGRPHEHDPPIAVLTTPADSTDGVDIEPMGLSGEFARGLLVMMNSRDRNFQLYSWDDVAKGITR
jgi:3-phytase